MQPLFFTQQHECDVFVDASEYGWGATVLMHEFSGLFDSSILGTSSTFRELSALLLILFVPEIVMHIVGMSVRFNMDSSASIRNLQKGGGPAHHLCIIIKAIWRRLKVLNIRPHFHWLRRSNVAMIRVDRLSKLNPCWHLHPLAVQQLHTAYNLIPCCPAFSKIGFIVQSAIALKQKQKFTFAFVLPCWTGMSWWYLIEKYASTVPLDKLKPLFLDNQRHVASRWKFVLALM